MRYTPRCYQLKKDFNVTKEFLENLTYTTLEEYGHNMDNFKISWNHSKRSLGWATKDKYGNTSIIFSTFLFNRLEDKREMVDVALHEVAHLLAGINQGHNRVWKSWCIKVGAKPERLSCARLDHSADDYKYALFCDTHGFLGGFSKKPKHERSCGKCSNSFNKNHLLKVVQNW